MTSRERIQATLRREKADALPNGWGGCETAGLHVQAYETLLAQLGQEDLPVKVDTFMFNAVVDPKVLTAMHGDVLLLDSPSMCSRPLHTMKGWKPHALFGTTVYLTEDHELSEDENYTYLARNGKVFARCPKGGIYFDTLDSGLSMLDMGEMPDPKSLTYRRQTNEEKLRQLEETAKRLYEETEFSLCCGEAACDLQLMPGGMMSWYDAMINEPDLAHDYLGRAAEAGIEDVKVLHQAVGKYCDMLAIAHDLGDRRGVTIGPQLFRNIYKPYYKQLFSGWHKATGMKVNMHSCGAISDIIDDLIECGVDVLNPVQISCDGMDPQSLKSRFGDRVIFYGGAYDAVNTPPGTAASVVYQAAADTIKTLAQGGGYIFAGVHNTPGDTPPEHLQSVLKAYLDVRESFGG